MNNSTATKDSDSSLLISQQNDLIPTVQNIKRKLSEMFWEEEDDKKIVEVPLNIHFDTKIFPQLIPKSIRFKCFSRFCSRFCMTYGRLEHHLTTCHDTYQCFICPHCPPTCIGYKAIEKNQIEFHLMHHGENLYRCQYCDYIDFNRTEMKAHMKHTHISKIQSSIQSNIIVIRQGMLNDYDTERAPYTVPQWICNLCNTDTVYVYSKSKIKSHMLMVHEKSCTFKCPICDFQYHQDNSIVLKDHLKLRHPNVAVPNNPKWDHI